MHFWRRKNDLERRLRRARPEPRPEFVEMLAERVEGQRVRRWSRLAFALSISTFMVGSFASFGGLSYAATGATEAVKAAKSLATKRELTVRRDSAASDQYGEKAPSQPAQPAQPAQPRPPQGQPSGGVAGAGTSVTGQAGALPFTGLPLLGTALGGFSLLGLGIGLRIRERRRE